MTLVWVYSGQRDLEINIAVFSENAKDEAKKYAQEQKRFFKKRLTYTIDLIKVIEKETQG